MDLNNQNILKYKIKKKYKQYDEIQLSKSTNKFTQLIKPIPSYINKNIPEIYIEKEFNFFPNSVINNINIDDLLPTFWIDTSDLTSLLRDQNNNIYTIFDKSGNQNNVHQPDVSQRPRYHNGGILFNNCQYLVGNNTLNVNMDNMSIFIVLKQYNQFFYRGGIISGFSSTSKTDYDDQNAWSFNGKVDTVYNFGFETNNTTLYSPNNIQDTLPFGVYSVVIDNSVGQISYNNRILNTQTFSNLGSFTNLVVGSKYVSNTPTTDSFSLALGMGINKIMSSSDGIIWYPVTNPSQLDIPVYATWNGSIWLMGAASDDNLIYSTLFSSTNGINWTVVTSGSNILNNRIRKIVWNGTMWIAVGTANTVPYRSAMYSSNGIDWTNIPFLGTVGQGNGICWNGNIWIAAMNSDGGQPNIAYSSDGINWALVSNALSIFDHLLYDIVWNGKIFVGVGGGTFSIGYSYDGIKWYGSLIYDTVMNGRNVAWNGNMWIVSGYYSPNAPASYPLVYSYDGINWIILPINTFGFFASSIAWNGSIWIGSTITSSSGNILQYSYDGITWFTSSSGSNNYQGDQKGVNYIATKYVLPYIPYNNYYNGEIYEVLVFDSVLSNEDKITLQKSLLDKWNTAQIPRSIPISNIYVWLDASSKDYFTLDQNNNVLAWNDKNFNLNFIQLDLSTLPYYNVYKPVFDTNKVIFNNSFLTMTDTVGLDLNNFSIFYVMEMLKIKNTPLISCINTLGNTDSQSPGGFLLNTPDNTIKLNMKNSSINYTNLNNQFIKRLYEVRVTNGVGTIYINGVNQNTTSFGTLGTGLLFSIGASQYPSFYDYIPTSYNDISSAMNIHEIIILKTSVSTNEKKQIYAYLNEKWGLKIGSVPEPNPTVWLDSNNSNSLTVDNNYNITAWTDLSSNNIPVTFNTNPKLKNINSRMAAYFDNSNITLAFNSNITGSNGSFYFVFSGNNFMSNYTNLTKLLGFTNTGDDEQPDVFNFSLVNNTIQYTSNNQCYQTISLDDSLYIISVLIDNNNTNIYVNNYLSNTFSRSSNYNFAELNIAPEKNTVSTFIHGSGLIPVLYSLDGINFLPLEQNIFQPDINLPGYTFKIKWNGTIWCATGHSLANDVYLYTSSNGINWTRQMDNPFINGIQALGWNGSYWLGGSADGILFAASTDGITWVNQVNDPTGSCYISIIETNGSRWVACGSLIPLYGSNLIWSDDGINWFPSTNPFAFVYNIKYNGSYWMIVGSFNDFNYDTISAISTDGQLWTLSNDSPFTTTSENYLHYTVGVNLGWNGLYWVVGGNSYDLMINFGISYNGMDWIPQTSVPYTLGNFVGTAVEWVDNRWIGCVSDYSDGGIVLTSVDGLIWDTLISYNSNPYNGIVTQYIPSHITSGFTLVLGQDVSSTNIYYTLDGTTFTPSMEILFPGGNPDGLDWNGTMWVLCGYSYIDSYQSLIYTSFNGLDWTLQTNHPFTNDYLSAICWTGTSWLIGAYYTIIGRSIDGITWTPIITSNGDDDGVSSIATSGSMCVACGSFGTIFNNTLIWSTDQINWYNASNNPFPGGDIGPGFVRKIKYNGSYWMAVGSQSSSTNLIISAKSTDGQYWTLSNNSPFSTGSGSAMPTGYDIAWNGFYWVMCGVSDDWTVYFGKSYNGMDWTPQISVPYTYAYSNSIEWVKDHWIASIIDPYSGVDNRKLLISSDGLTWTFLTSLGTTTGGPGTIKTEYLPPYIKPYKESNWKGYIPEIILYDTLLDDVSHNDTMKYLGDKWSIDLPSPEVNEYILRTQGTAPYYLKLNNNFNTTNYLTISDTTDKSKNINLNVPLPITPSLSNQLTLNDTLNLSKVDINTLYSVKQVIENCTIMLPTLSHNGDYYAFINNGKYNFTVIDLNTLSYECTIGSTTYFTNTSGEYTTSSSPGGFVCTLNKYSNIDSNNFTVYLGGWSTAYSYIKKLYVYSSTTLIATTNPIYFGETYQADFTVDLALSTYTFIITDIESPSGNILAFSITTPVVITTQHLIRSNLNTIEDNVLELTVEDKILESTVVNVIIDSTLGVLNTNNVFMVTLSNNENYDLTLYQTSWDIYRDINKLGNNLIFITSGILDKNQNIYFTYNPKDSIETQYFYICSNNIKILIESPIIFEEITFDISKNKIKLNNWKQEFNIPTLYILDTFSKELLFTISDFEYDNGYNSQPSIFDRRYYKNFTYLFPNKQNYLTISDKDDMSGKINYVLPQPLIID